MEKEIIEEIKKLISENKKIKAQLHTTENKLEHIQKIYDILFPLLFGMILGVYILVF